MTLKDSIVDPPYKHTDYAGHINTVPDKMCRSNRNDNKLNIRARLRGIQYHAVVIKTAVSIR
jgi:hypothetical protein